MRVVLARATFAQRVAGLGAGGPCGPIYPIGRAVSRRFFPRGSAPLRVAAKRLGWRDVDVRVWMPACAGMTGAQCDTQAHGPLVVRGIDAHWMPFFKGMTGDALG